MTRANMDSDAPIYPPPPGRLSLSVAVCMALVLIGATAAMAASDPLPEVRVEPGMHTAAITAAALDNTGQYLLTGGADATARLWDMQTQHLAYTWHLPSVRAGATQITAVALSAEGSAIAVGLESKSPTPAAGELLLLDRHRPYLLQRLEGNFANLRLLRFSGGRAAELWALTAKEGLRVLDIRTGKVVQHLTDCAGYYIAADVDSAGRLITACSDGMLHLYDARLTALAQGAAHADVASLRFSPDGQRVAVGYKDQLLLEVRSGQNLTVLSQPSVAGISDGDLRTVAWSASGETLFASGLWRRNGQYAIRRWGGRGTGEPSDAQVGAAGVNTLTPLAGRTQQQQQQHKGRDRGVLIDPAGIPDSLVVGTADHELLLLPPSGAATSWQRRRTASFVPDELLVDGSGGRVTFTLGTTPPRSMQFAVLEHALRPSGFADTRVHPPQLTGSGLAISDWKDQVRLLFNGHLFNLPAGNRVRRLALAPEERAVALATDELLLLVDAQGAQRWRASLTGSVSALNFSWDGRLVVAALADGSVRWYQASDGSLLLSLLCSEDGTNWIAWTPSGYYDASAGGDELLGWRLERPGALPDFFRMARLQESLHRPDIVERVLVTTDERHAIGEANAASGLSTQPLSTLLPPVVTMESLKDGAEVRSAQLSIGVRVRSLSGQPIIAVRAIVRDSLGRSQRVSSEPTGERAHLPAGSSTVYNLSLTLPPQDCELIVLAETSYSISEPAIVHLRWRGPPGPGVLQRADLYVLAIGVSRYSQPRLRLDYPAKDAQDIAALLNGQQGKLYGAVRVHKLIDTDATRARILQELSWLHRSATSDDVAVVFLAGHGGNDFQTNKYYFYPYEADPGQPQDTLLAGSELRAALSTIKAKTILFLDSCHSGNVVESRSSGSSDGLTRFANQIASIDSNIVVYTASTGGQSARESRDWNNGVFTKAVLEGLRGRADSRGTGYVSVSRLESYVGERVRELTSDAQTPATAKPSSTVDYPIAKVPRPLSRRWWFWSALGLGAAAVVTGVLLATEPWRERPPVVLF